MKNIYMSQPNRCLGRNIYLPYATGALIAYAKTNPIVRNTYAFKDIFFTFCDPDERVQKMDAPFLVGFSCYIWNYEYNLTLAKQIKETYPDCYIVFGGHNVQSNSSSLLETHDFIDFLIHDEGEVPFQKLLLALTGALSFEDVPNLSYRAENKIIKNPSTYFDVADFPSPYAEGVFDEIVKDDRFVFSAIFETNRGCPFGCAYCDWGLFKAKIRLFPMERVRADIAWLVDHKIDYLLCADANFGILDRDIEITDILVDIKKKTGYPPKICFCFTKNSNDTIFEINRKLHEVGLLKSAMLAIQSMNNHALENIGRKNLPFETFRDLNNRYHNANIPVLTELILGLPGETYESFRDGLCHLLEIGHHIPINIYNCELLMNSRMARPEYLKEHGIKSARVPLVGTFHDTIEEENAYPEFSNIVVETNTLSREDWIRANLFSVLIYSFHGMGLTQFIAQYLHYEKCVPYAQFYENLMTYIMDGKAGTISQIMDTVRNGYEKMLQGTGHNGCVIPWLSNIIWPFNETVFIESIHDLDAFYEAISPFLQQYEIEPTVFRELMDYQKSMIKLPIKNHFELNLQYDWHTYFTDLFKVEYTPLQKKENILRFDCDTMPTDWMDFVREMVWYGRLNRRMLWVNEAEVQYK